MTWDFESYLNETLISLEDESDNDYDITKIIEKYSTSNLRFFKKVFQQNLIAIGSPEYIVENPKTLEGYLGTRLYYRSHFVKELLPEIFSDDVSEI